MSPERKLPNNFNVNFDWRRDLPQTWGGFSQSELSELTCTMATDVGIQPEQFPLLKVFFADNMGLYDMNLGQMTFRPASHYRNYFSGGEIRGSYVVLNRSIEVFRQADHAQRGTIERAGVMCRLQSIYEAIITMLGEELSHAKQTLDDGHRAATAARQFREKRLLESLAHLRLDPYTSSPSEFTASSTAVEVLKKYVNPTRAAELTAIQETALQRISRIDFGVTAELANNLFIPTGWSPDMATAQ